MEPKFSLLCLREAATSCCPEQYQSNPLLPSSFLKVHFNIILSTSRSSRWSWQHGIARPQGDNPPEIDDSCVYDEEAVADSGERAYGAQLIDACITPETAGTL